MAKFRLRTDVSHGDWKTALVFPDRYPILKAGEVVEFVKEWSNFYGVWAEVNAANGSTYDIPPEALGERVKDEETK